MSAYDNDDRVQWPDEDGWPPDVYAHVGWQEDGSHDGYVVMWSESSYLTRPAVLSGDPFAEDVVGFGSVDDAIWSLIGDPQ